MRYNSVQEGFLRKQVYAVLYLSFLLIMFHCLQSLQSLSHLLLVSKNITCDERNSFSHSFPRNTAYGLLVVCERISSDMPPLLR
jgi:hypothetical protein